MTVFRLRHAAICAALGLAAFAPAAWAQKCDEKNTVVADVVAIDMPMVFNRLGAQNVNWQMYALRHDLVVRSPGQPPRPATDADITNARALVRSSVHITLRPDLRPRPLTLRVAAGECLRVNFTNLLTSIANPFEAHNWPLLPSGHPMDQRSDDPNMDIDDQVASRTVGFHPSGLELMGIASDSSHTGKNATSLVAPGGSRSYTFFAPAEGSFLVTNPGAAFGSEGTAGTSGTGLFGAVAVQPVGGRAYRGQVTEEELRLATRLLSDPALAGQPVQACAHDAQRACTLHGQPVVHYDAVYPAASPWTDEGKAGRPILAIEQVQVGVRKIVHGDVNAIIVGPQKDGSFPPSTYPLESTGVANPSLPNRLEAFREFVSVFHDENAAAQAFPGLFEHPVLGHTLHGVRDAFMINYGSAGVGAEVIANRLKVGPMHDCVDCAFEEFFLSSFTIGDPALLVDRPANLGLEQFTAGALDGPDLVGVNLQGKFAAGVEKQLASLADELAKRLPGVPLTGPKASKTYYPHDPANVHHSYVGDFVKFRNLHTGKEQHIFHLHNHQWLFNPNDDNSNYIDAQAIGPGAGYTYEIAFGGSGNRNKSAGDAVFHCHYYPHFAQGMWYLWRSHDTFEAGTTLAVSGEVGKPEFHSKPFDLADGTPAKGARALPDGEIALGTPIPAVVPLPGKPLAVMPGQVQVVANPRTLPDGRPVGSLAKVVDRDTNPGFPFWIAGIEDTVGSRPPTPPLDMLAAVGGADGGVPRHAVEGYSAGSASKDTFTRLDASKKETLAKPKYFPERGTDIERVAMKFHAQPGHTTSTVLPGGGVVAGASFVTNGGKPEAGAPFFDPCLDDKRQRLVAGRDGAYFGSNGLSLTGQSAFTADTPRIYKGANIQLDVTINKLGDHYPQQRILTLWEDVDATLATGFRNLPGALDVKQPRPPEPLVLRMNTFDCARYLHTNLVPKEFEMDDYQVRTPTDIIGQHIHLPKWDLPSADGSANGWNYEDGTFSPGMVRSRIHAINEWNSANPGARVPNPYAAGQPAFDPARPGVPANAPLTPQPHYYFGRGGPFQLNADACLKLWQSTPYDEFNNEKAGRPGSPGQCDWLGARTTIQRWFSDPIINKEQQHRGLGITFTHDHLGPSTHQQVGLYATMLTEPPASTWVHNETAELLYTRDQPAPVKCDDLDPATWRPDRRCDGGPTTWQAVIRSNDEKLYESHREFFLQFGDFQHAYRKDEYRGVDALGVLVAKTDPGNEQAFRKAVTPSFRKPASPNFPEVIALSANCPGSNEPFELKRRNANDRSRIEAYAVGTSPPVPRPCPELISADDIGTMVVNYRQEPVAARVMNLGGNTVHNPGLAQASQTPGNAGDLAFAYHTRTDRALAALNSVAGQTTYTPLTHDVRPGDPYTPLLRAYSGDLVRIKIQAGSHEHEHNGAINGLKWLQAGSGYGQAPHSGWRGGQNIGLSEQFTLSMRITDYFNNDRINSTDRLYATDTSQDGLWNGVWGLVRTLERRNPALDKAPAERDDQDRLAILPLNPLPTLLAPQSKDMRRNDCPADAPVRSYQLVAGLANRLLGPAANVALPSVGGVDPAGGTLVYNPRANEILLRVFHEHDDPATPVDERTVVQRTDRFGVGPLHDPTAILIVRLQDIDPKSGQLMPNTPVEPVVLRAAAGECVEVTLENRLPKRRKDMPDLAGYTTLSMLMPHRLGSGGDDHDSFNNNRVRVSNHIGLHPQMVQYDVQLHDGTVVGGNSNSLVGPGEMTTYKWYAGELTYRPGAFSGQECTVSEGVEGGYDTINFLRDHERQTADGPRLWRPPNQLFTRRTLLSRLESLLSPIDVDGTEPAADDTERIVTTTLRPRRLALNPTTLTALLQLRPLVTGLVVTATPPVGVTTAEFDSLLATSFAELLGQLKAANLDGCFDDAVDRKRADQTVPAEVSRNLAAVLGTPVGTALPAPDSAALFAPEAALSTVETLQRRESCAAKAREPMVNALVKTLANSRYANLSAQIAQQLASSIAYLVPELDADALGGKQHAQAFRWLEGRERASLSKQTTRLVNPMLGGGQCQFAAIEFGGTNLTPPDRIKQGQKAAVGAFVIEPERSLWWEIDTALDRQNPGPAPGARRATRTSAHAFYPAAVQGSNTGDWRYFRDLVAVHQKGLNMRYGKRAPGKSSAVGSIAAERADSWQAPERIAPEDAHDAGQMAINYGSEPMWFRFGMDPSAPFGHGPSMSNPSIPGEGLGALSAAFRGFADICCTAEDGRALPASPGPYTPIFQVLPRAETRMRVMMPTGVGRGSVMTLHGHGWQRDPYLAEKAAAPVLMGQFSAPSVRLAGGLHAPATTPVQYGVPSQCQGRSALGMRFGAQDSVTPMAHYDWLLESAGGFAGVAGDYLLRDIGGFGVTSGVWGLMRVQGTPIPLALRKGQRTACH